MSTQIIVQPGDSLWSLAAKHLGDPLRWKEIWRVNRDTIIKAQQRYPEARRHMRGPDWIFDGDKLTIPSAERAKPSYKLGEWRPDYSHLYKTQNT